LHGSIGVSSTRRSSNPVNPSSVGDVTLEDFARVFGNGGLYDAFFQANLAPLVDTSRATWRRTMGGG
jgi:type VI protein secretion system component VasK